MTYSSHDHHSLHDNSQSRKGHGIANFSVSSIMQLSLNIHRYHRTIARLMSTSPPPPSYLTSPSSQSDLSFAHIWIEHFLANCWFIEEDIRLFLISCVWYITALWEQTTKLGQWASPRTPDFASAASRNFWNHGRQTHGVLPPGPSCLCLL